MSNGKAVSSTDLVMGEDWTESEDSVESELQNKRRQRGIISLNRSPLARKIITFNLLALVILVAGVLFLNPYRDSLVSQHKDGLVKQARLVASAFEVEARGTAVINQTDQVQSKLDSLAIPEGVEAYLFSADGSVVARSLGKVAEKPEGLTGKKPGERKTVITDFLNNSWDLLEGVFGPEPPDLGEINGTSELKKIVETGLAGGTKVVSTVDNAGASIFSVVAGVGPNDVGAKAVGLSTVAGEIDALVQAEREQVLQMFVIATLVSIGLSLVLASTIANPLSDLAAAAELGRDKSSKKKNPGRVRIPDLTGRPDEIGRLSGAMRGMVSALYERIDANEQFAADVAHEIKNPLASLRSAVGTLHVAKNDEQRGRLLDVIEQDVRRLDRLISDISNASRLDSELVKEDEEPFDLMKMISNLTEFLGQQAQEKGVEFIRDVPEDPIVIQGLEARLAQVFVNLITNAISFCESGDAVRIWARKRENRVLVVVEDTGPGIPEQALNKVFNRFYSERPEIQFGNHSGLGLAISKQIVEAHGGVIWAENIRSGEDISTAPLGARFVVGLPI